MFIEQIFITFALITSYTVNSAQNKHNNEVMTTLGRVRGSLMKTRLGKDIYAFRGLRYAEAPVGALRFKIAVPAKSWKGVFDASQEGPSCFYPGGQNVSDDCLRLNIYTTKFPDRNVKKSPVIVFFHPGGFYSFSGQSHLLGPQYLLDEDIVLVTPNYRLGAIGFTAMGNALAPGNLGLKDQVEALRWVQANIAAFNGDPLCVTIAGYSSGSWSTALHMLSPMSRGLFHRVISMSGSPIKGELLKYEQRGIAKKQARLLGCPQNNTREILECFERIPGREIAETVEKFREWHDDPLRIWSPVVDPALSDVDRFVLHEPVNLIRRGLFTKVPFLAGSTLDEFGFQAMLPVIEAKKGNSSIFEDLNENWNHIAPIAFEYERNNYRSEYKSGKLKKFYFKDKKIGLQNWKSLAHLYGDTIVSFPMRRLVDLISKYSDQPVYYYHFVYHGRYSFKTWPDTKKPFGVVHQDDLMYLFYMQHYFPYFGKDAPELPTVKHMTAMWASFAKTGNPIPSHNPLFRGITWKPYDHKRRQYMEIDNNLTLKHGGFYNDRMRALDEIFPIPPLHEDINKYIDDSNEKHSNERS